MRQLVLDTETTGLNARTGDRVIEIGAVELVNRRLTGNNLHFYINPERDSDPGALAVHGLTTEFLSDKPKFAEIAATLREYLSGAELIIHNAPFDVGFLHAEFERLSMPPLHEYCGAITDTLVVAKQMFPGKRNSLDALCDRFGISNAHRKLHGALLDAELLADVYLAMTRGQESLVIESIGEPGEAIRTDVTGLALSFAKLNLPVLRASEAEQAAHVATLDDIERAARKTAVWRALPSEAGVGEAG
ncbi:DNA polymerase III subunit epsilon [Chitinasiproducens palmae]|uniref:DNA polymerase III subunit epsilon n=1 Tax=Chitinasiproducens palmae TaxID=1770053 RepID=A0A1H2PUV1_9BURK|nr:DNA polymerase III subunit epsilon [Chitinasiproducens palmae]SDV51015.1 DNA polymerase-3 subunit epsilon [Chitinasiproducens palmae]